MCVEFYLILAKAGATKKLMWQLIGLSTLMLVAGYVGESGIGDAVIFGTLSGLAYFVLAGMLLFGNPQALANKVIALINNPTERKIMGVQAKKVVDSNKGALDEHLKHLNYILSSTRD